MTTRSMPMTTIGVSRVIGMPARSTQPRRVIVHLLVQRYRRGLLRAEPLREGTRELAGSFETRTAKGRGLPRVSFYASQREFDSLTLFAGSTALIPHDMLGW
jgi:hypothetical protein